MHALPPHQTELADGDDRQQHRQHQAAAAVILLLRVEVSAVWDQAVRVVSLVAVCSLAVRVMATKRGHEAEGNVGREGGASAGDRRLLRLQLRERVGPLDRRVQPAAGCQACLRCSSCRSSCCGRCCSCSSPSLPPLPPPSSSPLTSTEESGSDDDSKQRNRRSRRAGVVWKGRGAALWQTVCQQRAEASTYVIRQLLDGCWQGREVARPQSGRESP